MMIRYNVRCMHVVHARLIIRTVLLGATTHMPHMMMMRSGRLMNEMLCVTLSNHTATHITCHVHASHMHIMAEMDADARHAARVSRGSKHATPCLTVSVDPASLVEVATSHMQWPQMPSIATSIVRVTPTRSHVRRFRHTSIEMKFNHLG